jgi:hypothetical protein
MKMQDEDTGAVLVLTLSEYLNTKYKEDPFLILLEYSNNWV